MCTSIISNRKKTIVGWNLDLAAMEYRVTPSLEGVYIEVSQTVCPTVVSMVFDVDERIVYWCENRNYQDIKSYQL